MSARISLNTGDIPYNDFTYYDFIRTTYNTKYR